MGIARDLGYLHVPPNTLIELNDLTNFDPNQVVIISTGSQGEPMSALSRIAARNHDRIAIEPGDTVVLASSLIPGNENSVFRVINGLTGLGAKVVHKGNAMVHVSGHASAGELLYCYNIVRPRNVLPVHGEIRHMVANADLAVQTGVPRHRAVVAEDGIVVDLVDGVARITGRVDCGLVYVDGSSVGDITESELKDRRILGEEGFISVMVVVDSDSGKIVAGPEIHARGFAEDESVFDDLKPLVADALMRVGPGGQHRHLPAAPGRPADRGALGQRDASAPSDDHPGRARGLRSCGPSRAGPRVRSAPADCCRRSSRCSARACLLCCLVTLPDVAIGWPALQHGRRAAARLGRGRPHRGRRDRGAVACWPARRVGSAPPLAPRDDGRPARAGAVRRREPPEPRSSWCSSCSRLGVGALFAFGLCLLDELSPRLARAAVVGWVLPLGRRVGRRSAGSPCTAGRPTRRGSGCIHRRSRSSARPPCCWSGPWSRSRARAAARAPPPDRARLGERVGRAGRARRLPRGAS